MADTGAELLRLAGLQPPALIILSDDLPDARAALLAGQIKADPNLRPVPMIAISRTDSVEDRLRLLRAGADEVFAQPLQDTVLQARVRSLIRARTGVDELNLREGTTRALGFAEAQTSLTQAAHVAILAPEAATATTWRKKLAAEMPGAKLSAHTFRDGLGQMTDTAVPDVFVIGLHGPLGAKGLRLLADIRANPDTRHAGILAIAGTCATKDLAADALDLGAGDLMTHGFDPQELALRVSSQIAQKQTQDRLRLSVKKGLRDAVRDPMTGLFNRRYAMPYLTRVIETNLQKGRGFAVMVADLDHFKAVNDRFGHAAGDAVLTEAAARLRDDLRAEDLIARMGGEEFLIVLPDSSKEDALRAGERLRARIGDLAFADPQSGADIHVTISIGVAVCCFECLSRKPPEESATGLLRLADEALYEAKGAGRNTVTLLDAA